MIAIENYEVVGWEHAIRGMRNPMNSWDRSDSYFLADDGEAYNILGDFFPWPDEMYVDKAVIGVNDLELMKKLVLAGTDHAKFRRMITVYMDITAPLYWWKEFDTYKVGTVANSCSTMHKIAEKEFVLDDFSHEHLVGFDDMDVINDDLEPELPADKPITILGGGDQFMSPRGTLECTIKMLNKCRELYLMTKNKDFWWQMIQLLPSSYNQKRTVMANYEVLANIYQARRNHKLDEWIGLCKFITVLPYSELITMEEEADD